MKSEKEGGGKEGKKRGRRAREEKKGDEREEGKEIRRKQETEGEGEKSIRQFIHTAVYCYLSPRVHCPHCRCFSRH